MSAFNFLPSGSGDASFMTLNGHPNVVGGAMPQNVMYDQQAAQSMLYPPSPLYTNYPWTHHTLQPPVLTSVPSSISSSAPCAWPESPNGAQIGQAPQSPEVANTAEGIPNSYIKDKLRSLGPQLWGDVSSCDCWVFVQTLRSSRDDGASASRSPTKRPKHFSMTADGLYPPMPRPKKPAEDFVSVDGKLYRVIPSPQKKEEEEQQQQQRPLTLPTILPVHSIFLTTFSPTLGQLIQEEQRNAQTRSLLAATGGMYNPPSLSPMGLPPTSSPLGADSGFHPPLTIRVHPPSPEAFAIVLHWIYTGDVGAMHAFLNSREGAVPAVLANMEWMGLRDSELAALCGSLDLESSFGL